ncbi:hypothetical protein BKH41_04060 [Helicobacter sp. 12S02232-10]|nr:hypothetical protein BKH41_04060 [Helicobacter sp. 12S02232-10]
MKLLIQSLQIMIPKIRTGHNKLKISLSFMPFMIYVLKMNQVFLKLQQLPLRIIALLSTLIVPIIKNFIKQMKMDILF